MATALLALAPAARADIGEKIILRCTHEESLSGFTQAQYNKALKELSADTEEYSHCSALIREAQTAAASGHHGAGSSSVSAARPTAIAPTPAEQQSITHAEHAGSGPVSLAGGVVQPGVVHADIASAFSSIPTPLLATVVFLIVCLLAVVGVSARNRVRANRTR